MGASVQLTLNTDNWDIMTPTERRNTIVQFEIACKSLEDDHPSKTEVTEYYANGCYGREIFIPKYTALVGEIHKTEWIIVVSMGSIIVATESGLEHIVAPYTFVSKAGDKRVGYALEDTLWTGFHATSKTNEADIREELIATSYDQLGETNVGSDSSTNDSNNRVTSNTAEAEQEGS